MPKMKTHKGAAKRLKKTASGKLKRWHAYHSHILTKKSAKRKQTLRSGALVADVDLKRMKRLVQS